MAAIKRLAAFARRVFPERFLRALDRRLESTNVALAAEEYVGVAITVSLVAGGAVGLAGMLLRPSLLALLLIPLAAAAAFAVSAFAVPYYLTQRRVAELERELPDALRQMASTLRAGVGADAAMDEVVRSKYGALSDEFGRAVAEVRKGRSLVGALRAIGQRSNSLLCVRAFSLIAEGVERGASIAGVLDSVAADAKEVQAIQRERSAATTQQILFLLAVALFAAPFIIGIVVAITGAGAGAGPMGGPGLPPGIGTVAAAYVVIQAFICALTVGIIRYGRASKGMALAVPFIVAAVVVFLIAQVVGGVAPA